MRHRYQAHIDCTVTFSGQNESILFQLIPVNSSSPDIYMSYHTVVVRVCNAMMDW